MNGEPLQRSAPEATRLSTAVCERLLYARNQDFDQAVTDALASIGKSMQASRCSLLQFHPATRRVNLTHHWCADGIADIDRDLLNVDASQTYPWLLSRLLDGAPIRLNSLGELPAQATKDLEALRARGIRSLLLLPMYLGNRPLGVFGVGTVDRHRLWSQQDIDLLESLRDLFIHALLRYKAEDLARETERYYGQIIDHSQAIVYAVDSDGRYTFVSPSVTHLTGYGCEAILGHHFTEFVDPADVDTLTRAVRQCIRDDQPTPTLEYRVRTRDGSIAWHRSVIVPIRGPSGRLDSLVANALDITDLRRQSDLRKLLLHLAMHFINLPLSQYDQGINEALASLTEFVGADRAYVFRYDFERLSARNTHEHCAAGIAPQIHQLQAVAIDDMQAWLAQHRSGQTVIINDVSEHPEQSTRTLLSNQGIQSLLAVPLMSDGHCVGFVGFDAVARKQLFSEDDIRLLEVFAEILVSLDERRQAQRDLDAAARRMSQIIDGTHAGTWEWHQQSRKLVFNQRWAEMLGYASADELPTDSLAWTEQVHPEDRGPELERFKEHLRGETDHHACELRLRHSDGRWIWLSLHGQVATRTADGRAELVSGIALDISARKEAEERLRLAASVFSHTHEGIVITDQDGNIIEVNDAFTSITGYSRAEAIGRNPRFLQSGRQDDAFYRAMWGDLRSEGYWSGEVWNRRKSGEFYAENLTISAIRDAEGCTARYVGLFSDITPHKHYQEHLERIAHFDTLTGLPNRTLLIDRLRQALIHTQSGHGPLVVAYIDVDDFQHINDRYGHVVGDECLRQIGQRLQGMAKSTDTVAHLGGDEFVLVLGELDAGTAAMDQLDRLLEVASQPYHLNSIEIVLTISIGATLYPQARTLEADQLIRQADQAMYQAKSRGRNQVCIFDVELEQAHAQRIDLIAQLRRALTRNELRLYYQPKVDLASGRVDGVEALIRWQHPEHGLVLPGTFLPALKGDALAHDIGHWVIDQALQDLSGWHDSGLELELSLNVSAQQLLFPGFAAAMAEHLARYPRIPARQLTLEFLETDILDDIERGRDVTRACRRLGIHFALDDFGTGFSSLSHLKHLALRQVKIDRSFVAGMLQDTEDLSIIEAVINLAKAFDLELLAEGVETIEQARLLLLLGCTKVQGYLIARPMPADQVAHWVQHWQGQPELQAIKPLGTALIPVLLGRCELAARVNNLHRDPAAWHEISSPSRFQRWLEQAAENDSQPTAKAMLVGYQRLLDEQQCWLQSRAIGAEQETDRAAARITELAQALSAQLERMLSS